jgi:hypothetical protein
MIMERQIELYRIEAKNQDDILLIGTDIRIPIFKIKIGTLEGYKKLVHLGMPPMDALVHMGIIGTFCTKTEYFSETAAAHPRRKRRGIQGAAA